MRLTLSLIGVAAVAILSLLCWQVQGPMIEEDLRQAVGSALGQAELRGLGVHMDGRDVTLDGVVSRAQDKALAERVAWQVPGIHMVRSDISLELPSRSDLSIRAQKLPTGRLELSGVVADSQAHQALLERARQLFGEAQVLDSLSVAGLPAEPGMTQAMLLALPHVAHYRGGEAEVVPGRLTLKGESPDMQSIGQTRMSLEAALPDQEVIIAVGRDWRPEDFQVVVTRVGDSVLLEGAVANIQAHGALVRAAGELWGQDRVDDRLFVGNLSQADETGACLRAALPLLPDIQAGVLRQELGALEIRGAVQSRSLRSELDLRLAQSCAAMSLDIELPIALSTWECQARLNAMLVGEPIRFRSGGAEIAPISDIDLLRLAETLRSCPDPVLEISGHTDSVGEGQLNQALSARRAAAVRMRLISLGIPPDRVVIIGLGEDRPVASNRTPLGRSKNRRIEFKLLPETQATP